jgi:DNA-binding response OmpR family regulator
VANVLILGDNSSLIARLEADLSTLGIKSDFFDDIDTCVKTVNTDTVDLLIVNYAPTICRDRISKLRDAWQTEETPILLIVDPAAVDMLELDSRINDIILADYDLKELSARLRRLISSPATPDSQEKIVVTDLVIDFESFEVSIEGEVIHLTFREYELLKFLAGNRGRVFTRKVLVENIWKYDYLSGTRTVDVHIRRLRSKLGVRYGSMIETIRNVGYRFSRYDN